MPKTMSPFSLDIDINEAGHHAIEYLAENTSLSNSNLKQVMQKGAVWLTRNHHTQRLRRAKKPLQQGDILHLYYDEKVLAEQPAEAQLLVDETGYSIWFKPYGMRCQGSKWGDHTTIYRYAEQHMQPQRPAFIVHRLDRAARGLIILAHSKTTANAFSRMFEHRQITKRYQAIVNGKFPSGPQHYEKQINNKPASSYASLVDYDSQQQRSLLEITIETGRKHQIRRHLSAAGFPIVGDRLYGSGNNNSENLQLVCHYLAFCSPLDGSEQKYPLPEDLQLHL